MVGKRSKHGRKTLALFPFLLGPQDARTHVLGRQAQKVSFLLNQDVILCHIQSDKLKRTNSSINF